MKFHTSAALWIAFATASSVDAFRVTSRPSVTLRPWRTALRAEGTKITMPALSSTMKEGRVVSWLKNEGDEIEAGEAIMVVESDKADMDVEAFEDGVLAKILVPEGAMAPVGEAVALMAENAADVASVIASLGAGSSASEPVLDAPAPTSGTYVCLFVCAPLHRNELAFRLLYERFYLNPIYPSFTNCPVPLQHRLPLPILNSVKSICPPSRPP
jgi:pyruvate dehydrogenase E2 component (dihydrolipoamide acetyltransferase)